MTSSAIHQPDGRPRATAVFLEGPMHRVRTADGRELLVPVDWFPWLAAAHAADGGDVRIEEGGLSLWWGRLDDGLSVPRLFGLPEWPCEAGMSNSTSSPSLDHPRAVAARVEDSRLVVSLDDGREVSTPLEWFDWLAGATPVQRADLRIIEGGAGIWWEQLEDAVSVPGLMGLPEYP